MAKPPKVKPNGEPDQRGHSEGSIPTRFAAGDGRRRPGRPKGARDEKTEVLTVRDMLIEVTIGGRKRRISTRLGYLLKMREKALKGDSRAAEWLDRKFAQFEPPVTDPDLTMALLAEDLEIIRHAQARGRAEEFGVPVITDNDTPTAEAVTQPLNGDE